MTTAYTESNRADRTRISHHPAHVDAILARESSWRSRRRRNRRIMLAASLLTAIVMLAVLYFITK